MTQHCGQIALIGLPNAGKSTLLNAILGTKISIVSRRPQTTRFQVVGIHLEGDAQMIFMDTPGIFEPKSPFEKNILQAAWQAVHECPVVGLLVDAKEGLSERMKKLLTELQRKQIEIVVLLNKIDLIQKPKLLGLAEQLYAFGNVKDIFMISALNKSGVADFVAYCKAQMPSMPWMYDESQLTNLPQRLLASELTREKLFDFLNQELPYDIMVETERWEETPVSVKIYQTIYVKRPSQKAIVLGANGQTIKKMGQLSREELSAFLDKPVHLFLHVKVEKEWHLKPRIFTTGHAFHQD